MPLTLLQRKAKSRRPQQSNRTSHMAQATKYYVCNYVNAFSSSRILRSFVQSLWHSLFMFFPRCWLVRVVFIFFNEYDSLATPYIGKNDERRMNMMLTGSVYMPANCVEWKEKRMVCSTCIVAFVLFSVCTILHVRSYNFVFA